MTVAGIFAGLVVLIGVPMGCSSVYTVDSGERAIVKTWGAVSDVVGDGMHLRCLSRSL